MPVWAWKNQPCDFFAAAISTTVRSLQSVSANVAELLDLARRPRPESLPPSGTALPFVVRRSSVMPLRPSASHGSWASLPTFSSSTSPAFAARAASRVELLALGVRARLRARPRGCGPCATVHPARATSPGDHVFRRALRDDLAAADAGLRAEVDDPVGRLDDVEIVLDDDDRVAEIDQAVQHVEQLADVVEVQAGRRFVEQVERLAGAGPGQFGGELHALGLAAGQRRRRLAERHVAEADVVERLQDVANLRDVVEQFERLADAHVQHVGDATCRGSLTASVSGL